MYHSRVVGADSTRRNVKNGLFGCCTLMCKLLWSLFEFQMSLSACAVKRGKTTETCVQATLKMETLYFLLWVTARLGVKMLKSRVGVGWEGFPVERGDVTLRGFPRS